MPSRAPSRARTQRGKAGRVDAQRNVPEPRDASGSCPNGPLHIQGHTHHSRLDLTIQTTRHLPGFSTSIFLPARGDQRERDRQRAQARKPSTKGKDDGLTPEQRRERDAKALQEKTAKKAAQAAQGAAADAKKKNAGKK
ncbi:hypothetical protein BRADI_2g25613v3 [Brachypodium distachyon]|uniref:Small EDRK-rich factor-like N-terminal domain-containing protein n=1 Tax=Brachypodium distachyon TaxID=15368 RepID=A0A0Q3K668_BRADI|nr:hypothetical protein BRADI_2g25613v3 [Brachypodium distachyon]